MLEKVEMGEKSNSQNTINEKKIGILSCWWRIFSQKGVEAREKIDYSQPESSRNILKIIQSIAVFFICSTETFETYEYV